MANNTAVFTLGGSSRNIFILLQQMYHQQVVLGMGSWRMNVLSWSPEAPETGATSLGGTKTRENALTDNNPAIPEFQ
jgi:hypothetical protein